MPSFQGLGNIAGTNAERLAHTGAPAGTEWFETTSGRSFVYNGSVWLEVLKNPTGTSAQRIALTGMSAGQQFFETDTKRLLIYDGSVWNPPWSTSWGVQYTSPASVDNTITSGVFVGLNTTFTFLNNRRYKVTVRIVGRLNTGRSLVTLTIGTLGGYRIMDFVAQGNDNYNFNGHAVVTGNGASHNITTVVTVVSGTFNLAADAAANNFNSLIIEDIGPA